MNRPNLAMLMIDSQILLTTTIRDLCGRLHSTSLVPFECPILVVESSEGVFGTGVSGEGAFSVYDGRDIELDPAAPVTAVLSVAFIPPEEGSEGGAPKPCVSCFLVDDLPQNRRKGSRASVDGVPAVFMECASAKPEKGFLPGTSVSAASTDDEPSGSGPSLKGPQHPPQQLRRSTRASTVAHSKAALKRARPQELSPPSTRVPLEDADTVFLVGDHMVTMARTTAWLQKSLGKEAVILGGISSCALVVGDQVLPRDKARRTPPQGASVPLVVGVALRGVHALAISAKGFEGVGPVFRVDATVDTHGTPQAQPGKRLRDVTVVSEDGAALRTTTAVSIFYNEVPADPAWGNHSFNPGEMYLGLGGSPAELLGPRQPALRDRVGDRYLEEAEEARGIPPVTVSSAYNNVVGLHGSVSPGQYARYQRTLPQFVLSDTKLAYQSVKRRIEREGSTVLSSLHFTCSVRPDSVELPGQQEQQPQPGGGGAAVPMETCVMALHQQEMVAFCKTLNAPACGVFCEGELGPLATLVAGIQPKIAGPHLQVVTTCTAALCWRAPGRTKSRASSVSQR
eukprot:g5376.t1